MSLFLTLLYHVSPLAVLLFFCSERRDISGHSRVAWDAGWGGTSPWQLIFPLFCVCVRWGEAHACHWPVAGVQHVLFPFIRLGGPRCYQALSLHLYLWSLIGSRWQSGTPVQTSYELHIWQTVKEYLKEPCTQVTLKTSDGLCNSSVSSSFKILFFPPWQQMKSKWKAKRHRQVQDVRNWADFTHFTPQNHSQSYIGLYTQKK